ncbi:MAG: DUF305 domain-containing protein [Chitinophagaceae bacterium]|nr:DUF305 domain-containing protein [Rubrivivax sp.]
MKVGRRRWISPASLLLAGAAGAVLLAAALLARADGASSKADALLHHDHSAAAIADAQCASTEAKSKFQREMDAGMGRMMADMHSPGYSGDVDVDFLAMMVPHHEGAVDMARLVLEHGRDPATRMLAEEIIAGQTIEIESMRRRLAALRQGADASVANDFPALGGTRGP